MSEQSSRESGDALDLVARLLAGKSEQTRRAYRTDLTDFFQTRYGSDPTPELVREFVSQTPDRLEFALAVYRSELQERGLAPATVNRRLAAMRSLLEFCRGRESRAVVSAVKSPLSRAYRQTSGLAIEDARRLLQAPDRDTLRGKRDYALLLLLLENALRSGELRGLTVGAFSPAECTLRLPSRQGKSDQAVVHLTDDAAAAITDYLDAAGHGQDAEGPLFRSIRTAGSDPSLSTWGLHKIVRGLAQRAGIDVTISPLDLRHTAITAALQATDGDVAQVQQLSRHARVEAVVRYNANRETQQARVSSLLGAMYRPADPAE